MKHWEKKNTFIYHSSLGVYARRCPTWLRFNKQYCDAGAVFSGGGAEEDVNELSSFEEI